MATGIISLQYINTGISILYGNWETGVLGLALMILSVCILVYVLRPRHIPEAIISNSEIGKVCITLGAVESLVQKVVHDMENVNESKICIKKQDDGVAIVLKITVNYDVTIPELTSEMQTTVKSYVESTAGISVKNVRIIVSNVSNPKAKVVK